MSIPIVPGYKKSWNILEIFFTGIATLLKFKSSLKTKPEAPSFKPYRMTGVQMSEFKLYKQKVPEQHNKFYYIL